MTDGPDLTSHEDIFREIQELRGEVAAFMDHEHYSPARPGRKPDIRKRRGRTKWYQWPHWWEWRKRWWERYFWERVWNAISGHHERYHKLHDAEDGEDT